MSQRRADDVGAQVPRVLDDLSSLKMPMLATMDAHAERVARVGEPAREHALAERVGDLLR